MLFLTVQAQAELTPENIKTATVILYAHGTTRPQKVEDCRKWYNQVPEIISVLEKQPNTHVMRLCSKATDAGKAGSYIFKRAVEIDQKIDELLDIGVDPQRLFLAGHSAGAWSILMLMENVNVKFNAAILFAPACCGPRHEEVVYPIWRKKIRPRQVEKMLEASSMDALIFTYPDDLFNRKRELTFLTDAYPKYQVNIISLDCKKGHLSHLSDCQFDTITQVIQTFISKQLPK